MTNDTTPAPIGADALRVAAQAALTALENLHEIDTETECITIDVRDEIDALRAALADAAQPTARRWPSVSGVARDVGHSRAVIVYLADVPTDAELRALHDTVRGGAAADPKAAPAAQVERLSQGTGYKASHTATRETIVEWLDALDIEVTDKQLDGLFFVAATQQEQKP